MLPNFLIVGTMKSGTTSLHRRLESHPDVFIVNREVHYFSRHYDRGQAWYEAHFDTAGRATAIGERSPPYSSLIAFPDTPERIARMLPEARLIWMFREPVARAHSQWWHSVRAGSETVDFETALQAESDGEARNPHHRYVARSRYVDQVRTYLKFFPRQAMHFIVFEDFVRDQHAAARGVYAFLGVDPDRAPARARDVVANPGQGRSRISPIKDLKAAVRAGLRRLVAPRGRGGLVYRPLGADVWTRWAERFRAPNAELADLVGLDLAP